MSLNTLMRQLRRRGPVCCYYSTVATPSGYRWSHSSYGHIFSFGMRGHYIALGWTKK
jgi:hypothetical protein